MISSIADKIAQDAANSASTDPQCSVGSSARQFTVRSDRRFGRDALPERRAHPAALYRQSARDPDGIGHTGRNNHRRQWLQRPQRGTGGACGRVVVETKRGYGNAYVPDSLPHAVAGSSWEIATKATTLARSVDSSNRYAVAPIWSWAIGWVAISTRPMPWLHRYVGNPVLSRFLNLLFRTGVRDSHCGLRAFSKEACERMNLRMPGMELASEIVIKSAMAGLKIVELPTVLYPDGRERRPHLRWFRDGWRHLRFMLMCSPLFLFVIPGLLLTIAGLLAIPIAMLAGYGVFTDHFGPNFLFAASLCALLVASAGVRFSGQLYAAQIDPVFKIAARRRWARWLTVERR